MYPITDKLAIAAVSKETLTSLATNSSNKAALNRASVASTKQFIKVLNSGKSFKKPSTFSAPVNRGRRPGTAVKIEAITPNKPLEDVVVECLFTNIRGPRFPSANRSVYYKATTRHVFGVHTTLEAAIEYLIEDANKKTGPESFTRKLEWAEQDFPFTMDDLTILICGPNTSTSSAEIDDAWKTLSFATFINTVLLAKSQKLAETYLRPGNHIENKFSACFLFRANIDEDTYTARYQSLHPSHPPPQESRKTPEVNTMEDPTVGMDFFDCESFEATPVPLNSVASASGPSASASPAPSLRHKR
ncbi:hypothetical protein JCM11641_003825, partial [Rhodosporidiobolus odoratus]